MLRRGSVTLHPFVTVILEGGKRPIESILAIALLVKNNAEVKRFTALNILNYLFREGLINGEHRYVVFKYNKFVVRTGGVTREFLYTEPFFINALIGAFTCISCSAQKMIDRFVEVEAIEIDEEEQVLMINQTLKYISE